MQKNNDSDVPRGRLLGIVTSIIFPGDMVRSRRVVTRGRATSTGKFPSWKMSRMLQWESRHELDAILWLEAMPSVRTIHEQPCAIDYVLDGEEHVHFPDLLVGWSDRREFWEIKSAEGVNDPAVQRRAALLKQELPQHGYQYRLVSSDELPKKDAIRNIRLLLRWGREPVSVQRREQLRQLWAGAGIITWGALRDAQMGSEAKHEVCRLILEGQIAIPTDRPIAPESPMSWNAAVAAAGA